MKTATLPDFLTPAEISRAIRMYQHPDPGESYARRVARLIIEPNRARIDAALGQQNDPLYLAYTVEYVVSRIAPHRDSQPLAWSFFRPNTDDLGIAKLQAAICSGKLRPGGQYYNPVVSFSRPSHRSILDSPELNDSERSQLRANDTAARRFFAHRWTPYLTLTWDALRSAWYSVAGLPTEWRAQWITDRRAKILQPWIPSEFLPSGIPYSDEPLADWKAEALRSIPSSSPWPVVLFLSGVHILIAACLILMFGKGGF